jgi:hypothetical protein
MNVKIKMELTNESTNIIRDGSSGVLELIVEKAGLIVANDLIGTNKADIEVFMPYNQKVSRVHGTATFWTVGSILTLMSTDFRFNEFVRTISESLLVTIVEVAKADMILGGFEEKYSAFLKGFEDVGKDAEEKTTPSKSLPPNDQ